MSKEPIELFLGVEILPNIDKQHAIEYLKRYCTIDDLDDSIYVKKLGNDGTTFAMTLSMMRLIKLEKLKMKMDAMKNF